MATLIIRLGARLPKLFLSSIGGSAVCRRSLARSTCVRASTTTTAATIRRIHPTLRGLLGSSKSMAPPLLPSSPSLWSTCKYTTATAVASMARSLARKSARGLFIGQDMVRRGYRSVGPPRSSLPRLQLPEGDGLIYGLIGINVVVFGMWTWARSSYTNTRFMLDHFTCSARGVVQELRLHTLFTNMFSHNSFTHLLVNSVTLYFFGSEALALLGARQFLNLYLTGGLVSSLCCVAWPYIAPSLNIPASYRVSKNTSALGASGAINAVVALSILTFPSRMVYVYMILPVPAALLGALFLVKDLTGLYQGGGGEANAGHLGGALVGTAYFLLRRF